MSLPESLTPQQSPAIRTPRITDEILLSRQNALLRLYVRSGRLVQSCRHLKIPYQTHLQWRANDTLGYIAKWDYARSLRLQIAEEELEHRAIKGDLKPVGFYQGKPSAYIREKSDTLLMFHLKALDPEKYRETSRVELTGKNGGPIDIRQSPIRLDDLSPDAQMEIFTILERELGPKIVGSGDTNTGGKTNTNNINDIPSSALSAAVEQIRKAKEIEAIPDYEEFLTRAEELLDIDDFAALDLQNGYTDKIILNHRNPSAGEEYGSGNHNDLEIIDAISLRSVGIDPKTFTPKDLDDTPGLKFRLWTLQTIAPFLDILDSLDTKEEDNIKWRPMAPILGTTMNPI